jgi:predicted Fe-Mo cluster-binding NifX family protein
MKVAIPAEYESIEKDVCVSFGRTPYFLIYDTDTKDSVFIDNSAAANSGGAGIKAGQILVDQNVNVLITPQCGENAAKVLNEGYIEIYKSIKYSIKCNIEAFMEGKLSVLDEIHSGFHNHGER